MSRVVISGPKETSIESWVVQEAWSRYKVKGLKLTPEGEGGWPDRIFLLHDGRPFLIEFKKPGEEPEPRQKDRHKKLLRWGYIVEVHDDRYEAIDSIGAKVEAARVSEAMR